jgi:hypothetical protein
VIIGIVLIVRGGLLIAAGWQLRRRERAPETDRSRASWPKPGPRQAPLTVASPPVAHAGVRYASAMDAISWSR